MRASPGDLGHHHLREVGGQERRPAAGPGDRLPPRRVQLLPGEDPARGELPQHPVARHLGRLRVERRVVLERGARQGRQQRDLPQGELVRPLPEVEPRRRPDPLDVAAVGGEVQVHLQDLVLGEPPLDLERPEALAGLGPQRPPSRIGHPRHLHGDGRGARHHLPAPQVGPRRPRQRQRIDPRMAVEPLVLRGHQRPPHLRGELRELDRQPPPLVRGRKNRSGSPWRSVTTTAGGRWSLSQGKGKRRSRARSQSQGARRRTAAARARAQRRRGVYVSRLIVASALVCRPSGAEPSLSQPSLSRPPPHLTGERGLKKPRSFCLSTNHSLFSRREGGEAGRRGPG